MSPQEFVVGSQNLNLFALDGYQPCNEEGQDNSQHQETNGAAHGSTYQYLVLLESGLGDGVLDLLSRLH